ncbi:unnamed protein product [Cylicocyclus nassatus]|uniref:Uncharacterized protein n=1 Tax=Cylicocyclus nassatus TaxID=53992 RepID=A0AA36GQX4_CYLNA|nr:unnamed protein product [Cylicocyclus nassatus]
MRKGNQLKPRKNENSKYRRSRKVMEVEENNTNEPKSVVENPAPPPRKRGRPPKKPRQPADSEEAPPNGDHVTSDGTPHKKRGRKSKAELAALASSKESPNEEESQSLPSPSSEKRRRPSAYSYAEYSDASEGSDDEMPAKPPSPKKTDENKAPSAMPSGKRRGRPPKSHKKIQSHTPKRRGRPPKSSYSGEKSKKDLDNGHDGEGTSPLGSSNKEKHSVITEKKRRGRPKKSEKLESGGKWSDVSTAHAGKFTLPLPVPDSWPLVNNMDEIMTELVEMYNNVKREKRGEFHNQIKAFVFALQWEDGSYSSS